MVSENSSLFLLPALLLAGATLFASSRAAGVILRPQGLDLQCPSRRDVGRTLTCNVTGTILRWDVSLGGGTPQTVFFSSDHTAPTTVLGAKASALASPSSQGISSRLTLPDWSDYSPVKVECSDGSLASVQVYSLKYIERPDPVRTLLLEKNSFTGTGYVLHWKSPHVLEKVVDSYLVTIADVFSSPPVKNFSTVSSNLSVELNYNINYNISLIANNCAGNSDISEFEITTVQEESESTITGSTVETTAVMDLSTQETSPTSVTPWLIGVVVLLLICCISSFISFVVGCWCGWRMCLGKRYSVVDAMKTTANVNFRNPSPMV